MVKIIEKTSETSVLFERNTTKNIQSFNISFISEGSNKSYEFPNMEDKRGGGNFYAFTLDLHDLPDAEYRYILRAEDENVDYMQAGLCFIGDLKHYAKQYQSNNGNKQYNG